MRTKVFIALGGLACVGLVTYAWRHDVAQLLPPALASLVSGPPSSATVVASAPGDTTQGKTKADQPQPSGRGRGGSGPAPVTAAVAKEQTMPVVLSAPGTVEALATVAIRARVDGQIMEVAFKEGDLVKEGQLLFRLDNRLAVALIRQAEANVLKDQAALKDALATLERRELLFQKRYASEASTDTARMQAESLKASIAAGQASLEAQKTLMDYLVIRAPITGRTGSISAKQGAMVRVSETGPLVTINQTRPIAVTFALPQIELDALKRALANKAVAEISVPGADPVKLEGVLHFVDNQVAQQTGTVLAKVVAENADERLWPGQAVGVDLTVDTKQNMVAIPASGAQPAQQGMIAWVIGDDNRVSVRKVTVERIVGQTAYIGSGLKAGERVVTDGQLRLSPGTAVNIHEPRVQGENPERRGKGKT